MRERYVPEEMSQEFLDFPVWSKISLPAGVLNSSTIDDGKPSYTEGPINVYALREKKSGQVTLWIADGNHRYFSQIREAHLVASQQGKRLTEDEVAMLPIEVVKVIPNHENDIRFMFNAYGTYEQTW